MTDKFKNIIEPTYEELLYAVKKINSYPIDEKQKYCVVVRLIGDKFKNGVCGRESILGCYPTPEKAQDIVREIIEDTGIPCATVISTGHLHKITNKIPSSKTHLVAISDGVKDSKVAREIYRKALADHRLEEKIHR